MFAASVRVPPAKIAATAKSRGACGPSFVFLARPRSCEALKSPRNATGIAMTNLHRSPPMNQSETDLGIANESQLLGFGINRQSPRGASRVPAWLPFRALPEQRPNAHATT